MQKKYFYDRKIWGEIEYNNAESLTNAILEDKELTEVDDMIIGCWGRVYDNSVQVILDKMVENREKFQQIQSLFVGDMEYEECEISWIEQGDYEEVLKILPNLKKLKIKGSNGLRLGKLEHKNLEELEIICGGLPKSVIWEIIESNLPNLKKLNLYLGVNCYGFDGSIEDIRVLLHTDMIKKLIYLGLGNSEIQNEIVEEIVQLPSLYQIKTLDLSKGVLRDRGGQMILDHRDIFKNLHILDLTYHYLSNNMMEKLSKLGITVILDHQEQPDIYQNQAYYYPMLT